MATQTLLTMARGSILAPRAGAAMLLRMRLPPQVAWLALALMAIAAALLNHVSFAAMPADAQAFFGDAMRAPLRTALIQWAAMLVAAQLVTRVGRWRGGSGRLADAALLIAWLQFILLLVQVVQIVVQLALPALGGMLSLLAIALLFWLLTNFVAELHGFGSLPMTFLGILGTMLVTAFVLASVFALILNLTGRA